MSDSYSFNPEELIDPANVVGLSQRRAQREVVTSLDDDSEQAARANDLAEATGVHPALVYGDQEHFEQQHKARLATQIVEGNPYLQAYVNSHPLAAKVSNDDYGQLDAVSQALSKYATVPGIGYVPEEPNSVLKAGLKGFVETADFSGLAGEHEKLAQMLAANPVFGNIFIRQATLAGATTFEGAMRAATGVIGGASAGIGELYKQLGGNEAEGNRLTRDLIVLAQVGLSGQAGLHGPVAPEVHAMVSEAARVSRAVEPYVSQGKEPPVGIHPVIDEFKTQQVKVDADNLAEALKESAKSATRERSPDLFASYIRQITDGEIGIKADAIRELYGDKVPSADDGILGWVPGLSDKLAAAEATGGDVQVPIADWLAKVEPDVAKQLEDHIRARPEGVTVEESKLPLAEAYHGSPYEFEAFDNSKIGSGEGAQAFAYGHYVAESPDLAQFYQNKLGTKAGTKGSLYGVKIKQPKENFLSWEQDLTATPVGKKLLDQMDSALKERLQEELDAHNQPALEDLTGGMLHRLLERYASEGDLPGVSEAANEHPRRAVAEYLASQGVPGITFLDEKSRAGGAYNDLDATPRGDSPTRNYVVFSNKDLEIVYRNGEAVRAIRQAAGLQGIQERKLALVEGQPIGDAHIYSIKDVEGKDIGHLNITEEAGGKRLYIDDTGVEGGAGKLGNKALLQGARQLFEQFPNAEQIVGEHVSGAKEKAGKPSNRMVIKREDVIKQEPFSPAPPGFTIEQYKLYLKNIEKRQQQDAEAANARVMREQRRRQSAEWEENKIKLRPEAVKAVNARPDFATDSALRDGSVRIHPDTLSPEQRAALPKEYLGKEGLTADQAATRFGFATGDQMVESLARFNADRKQSGLRNSDYTRRLINDELNRRMEVQFGRLNENILKEAKDQVASEIQEEMLHQQTMRYAELAGEQYPVRKEPTIAAMREDLDRTPIGEVSSDKFFAEAGRAGRAMELADLKQDWAEGFRQSQFQKNAMLKARMVLDREEQIEKFEKLLKKFSKRDPEGVATEHTNFIHQIMSKLGLLKQSTRSLNDLNEEIARKGYPDLASFVSSRKDASFGLDQMPVADFLMDEKWQKPFKELTGEEFDQVHDSVSALAKMGADEKKLIDRGNTYDLEKSIGDLKDELKTFPLKQTSATPTLKSKILYYPRSALASATATETMFNRFDRNNPRGPGNRLVNFPLAAAANAKDKLLREFSKPMQALGKVKNQNKLVESPLIDPLTITDENPSGSRLSNFTVGNVQTMIHNAGNWSNWTTFARGWGRDPIELWQWLQNNSTKEMWDRGQQMGKTIFKPAFEKAQASYERIYGVAPAKLELQPFEVRHPDGSISQYEGWYHPLIPDPAREFFIDSEGKLISGQSAKQRGGSAYDGPDNFHARTTNGYTKSRTGAAYPVDLNPDMIPVRLTQMLHDIAYREPIINVEKIFRNPGFRNELTKHYGDAYTEGLKPYLQSLAGEMGIHSKAYSDAQRVSEYFRQNVVGSYIGFNPSTPLKHGPTAWGMSMWQAGPGAWARATWDIYARGEKIYDANKAWIDDTFEEVGRRRRFWQDTIAGQHADIYGKGTSREKFIEAGSWAVSQSDMFSVRGTALALYRKELARQEAAGEQIDHGLAIDIANQGVRFAHGSTSAANRPAMVRGGGPLGSWMTSIYGFMGTIMQRRIEIAHVIADQYRDVKAGEFTEAFRKAPDLAGRIVTHVILPIAIEEMVTGLTTDDRRGWGEHIATALFDGLARSALYLRDITYSLMGSHAPSAGLMTGPIDDARKVIEDLKKGKHAFTGPAAGKFVGDTMTALGDLTGRSTKTLGAITRFGINYSRGYERPKSMGDWYRGLARGSTKPRLVQ